MIVTTPISAKVAPHSASTPKEVTGTKRKAEHICSVGSAEYSDGLHAIYASMEARAFVSKKQRTSSEHTSSSLSHAMMEQTWNAKNEVVLFTGFRDTDLANRAKEQGA